MGSSGIYIDETLSVLLYDNIEIDFLIHIGTNTSLGHKLTREAEERLFEILKEHLGRDAPNEKVTASSP